MPMTSPGLACATDLLHYECVISSPTGRWFMGKADDIERNLRRAPLFCDISSKTLRAISQAATARSYKTGERLFSAGERPDYLHVLIEGPVKLTANQSDGRESIIELLQPVDSFLMAAVLTSKPYLLSAEAIGPVRVLLIPSDLLRQHVTTDPHLALMMIASLANQYRQ